MMLSLLGGGLDGVAEGGAALVPLGRAEAGKGLGWRTGDRRELPLLQVTQQAVAGLDDAAQQQARDDGDDVAKALGHLELDLRRRAAAHDVQQTRPLDALR